MRSTVVLLAGLLAVTAIQAPDGMAADGARARDLASRVVALNLGQANGLRDAGHYEAALERIAEARDVAREFALPEVAIERAHERTVEQQRLRAGASDACACRQPVVEARLFWSPPIF